MRWSLDTDPGVGKFSQCRLRSVDGTTDQHELRPVGWATVGTEYRGLTRQRVLYISGPVKCRDGGVIDGAPVLV